MFLAEVKETQSIAMWCHFPVDSTLVGGGLAGRRSSRRGGRSIEVIFLASSSSQVLPSSSMTFTLHPHKHCKIAYIDIFNIHLTLLPWLLTFSAMSFKLRRNIFGTVLCLCDVCFTAKHRRAASEVQRVHMRAFTEEGVCTSCFLNPAFSPSPWPQSFPSLPSGQQALFLLCFAISGTAASCYWTFISQLRPLHRAQRFIRGTLCI